MTLLIAAKYASGILVTADGRSNLTSPAGQSIETDSLQKVFPHARLPLALAHHGQNKLLGKPVAEFIREFLEGWKELPAEIDPIVTRLSAKLDDAVVKTLREHAQRKYCGFWVLACLAENRREAYEVDWLKRADGIARSIVPHAHLLLGGDCAGPIKKFLGQPIDERLAHTKLLAGDARYAQDVSDELYARVMSEGLATCGGHRHQLQITATGTRWVVPPL